MLNNKSKHEMATLLSHKSTDQEVIARYPTLNHVPVLTTCDARFSTVPAPGLAHTSTSIQQHNRSLNMNPADVFLVQP